MNPVARSVAASYDHARWCVGEMPDAVFVARTRERIAEQDELHCAQAAEEDILLLHTERILAELSEALCEYVADRPRGGRESAVGAERAALLCEAARLIGAAAKVHAPNVAPAVGVVR